MSDYELRERGYFWWTDETPTDGSVAPETGAFGELRIAHNGEIELDLDGMLPTKTGPFENLFFKKREVDKLISGILKKVNQHVLLLKVRKGPATVNQGFLSYQTLRADMCLVGKHKFAATTRLPGIKSLHLPLDGFEEWLWLDRIKISSTRDFSRTEYKNIPDEIHTISIGKVVLSYDIFGQFGFDHSTRATQMRQVAEFIIKPKKYIDLDAARKYFNLFQDLMIVLTNNEQSLSWPKIKKRGAPTPTTLYFSRLRSPQKDLKLSDCWLMYPRIRNVFGSIVDSWLSMSEKYGPGIYLLLGHRKGMQLYSEHQFISLVWGLESLHRSLTVNRPKIALSEKAERIVAQVSPSSDKKWLKKKLEFSQEPSLAERIEEIIKVLPVAFPHGELKNFADACAALRNDISHFGGQRGEVSRDAFYRLLMIRSEALSILYQSRVLQLIGISDQDIKWVLKDSPKSFRLRYLLWLARLADREDGFDGDQLEKWEPAPRSAQSVA